MAETPWMIYIAPGVELRKVDSEDYLPADSPDGTPARANLTLGTLELRNGARWFRNPGHVAVVEVHPHPVEGTPVLWCTTQINLHVLDNVLDK